MRAVGHYACLPVTDAQSLCDLELPPPAAPTGRDLLVAVQAIAVNPVDTKIRRNRAPAPGTAQVLGWDAAGTVLACGPDCTRFRPGDAIWYAGDVSRPGCNAQQQLVDERIVGHKPATLDFAAAAALPLTAITAWELLFDRFRLQRAPAQQGVLLVVGGAGGVGSMAIQLARALTGMRVVATASRDASRDWCLALGAHHVIDHRQPLPAQLAALGLDGADAVLSLTATDQHFAGIAELVRPQGCIGLIDDPAAPPDIRLLKRKSVSLHWEFMFTRPLFATADLAAQHGILQEVARLVDAGLLRSTLRDHYGVIDAANLRRAHAQLESGGTIGKIVLEGFSAL